MKKFYLSLISAVLSLQIQAQSIPCANLETWVNSNESGSTYLIPQGWITGDQLQNAFDPSYTGVSVVRSTSARTGQYAALMQTVIQGTDTMNGVMITAASLATFISSVFGGPDALGFPYATRSANLTGWYRYTAVGGDSAAVMLVMTKWNSSMGTRDTLAVAVKGFGSNVSSYTQFTIPITYTLNLVPDTAAIVMAIDGPNGDKSHVGTQFFVDDLAFTGVVPVGIQELQAGVDLVRLYPNPASQVATIELNTALSLEGTSIIVYHILGNEVRTISDLSSYMFSVDCTDLPRGLYQYRLLNGHEVIAGGKFMVQ